MFCFAVKALFEYLWSSQVFTAALVLRSCGLVIGSREKEKEEKEKEEKEKEKEKEEKNLE